MNRDNIKPFHKQFCECKKLGLNNNTKYLSFKNYPGFAPRRYYKYKENREELKGVTLLKCDKFGGICSSQNKKCRKLRGWED